ncbi:hypothetical protein Z951_43765 [Streptomyces sp. PRh5]|uniref:type I polyketide synthase n=1 Tax=Streptomyces sp. PRh5 TaxID=1158056 RepID=UPI00044FE515|nr:type I polyketide synthase [Streptomyces sp. PRh5]EXU62043.1 hypothetical protein Z951_43765 [Streptomyces sp. PRh5]
MPDIAREPIAIVGMGCRFPGGVDSPQDLWELVSNGRETVSEMPRDRGWDFVRLGQWEQNSPGSSATRFGSFLDDGADFDPEFFGISEREAMAMHPAQRLVMLTSWEAFEDAGIPPAGYRGQDVAVYVGFFGPEDYGPRWHNAPQELRGRVVTGSSPSLLAGRLSYFFGFHGPSATLDTACSGSLVGVHLACQSLCTGEADLALAGGATFHGLPGVFTEFSKQGALAPDGRSKSFADSADGTGWGEGAGMLLLARLSDAQRLGYRVHAVIRGSAVNHDGASRTLTAPSQEAQEQLIRKALAQAGLDTADIDVMEAHGTGTRLGDPIEARAILATYGQRSPKRPLLLGSAKPNIGHTLAAAGAGGLIKMVQALRHGLVPMTLHTDKPNPLIDWSTGTVRLATRTSHWPAVDRPRRAAVSSFGVSGTNAHVIVEEARPTPHDERARPHADVVPWVLSARTNKALRDLARKMAPEAGAHVADVGFSLATGRTRFVRRAVVLGRSPEDFRRGLDALASGQSTKDVVVGDAVPARDVAFVFPGQGTQWAGMAVELAASSPVFRQRLSECADALAPYCDWSLTDVLHRSSALDRVDVVQPTLFAVMVALATQWEAYGVRPSAVVGHSQGEIAAACVAGALSLPDAARVVALRSRALATLAGDYGMAAVSLGQDDVRDYVARRQSSIAVVNGPRSTVLAGPREELLCAVADIESRGERARMLPVDYASHSSQVEAARERILDALADIEPQAGRIPIYSSVTGQRVDGQELTAEYWYRNLRDPVRFDLATEQMLEDGFRGFVEASPHPVLLAAIESVAESVETNDVAVVGSLRRADGGHHRFVRSLAEAHVRGVEFDADSVFGKWHPRRVELPTYPFQTRRLWVEPDREPSGEGTVGHPWLSKATPLADCGGCVLTGSISLRKHPWLADHQVQERVVVPGAAVVDLIVTAAREVGNGVVSELVQHQPLVVLEELDLQVAVGGPESDGSRTVRLFSRARVDEPWVCHADGVLMSHLAPETVHAAAWPPADAVAIDPAAVYSAFAKTGIHYGPAFQAVKRAWRRGHELFAEAALTVRSEAFGVHPVLLDAALHVIGLSAPGERQDKQMLPFTWTGVSLRGIPTDSVRVHARKLPDGRYSLRMTSLDGRSLLAVDALEMRAVAGLRVPARAQSSFRQVWRAVPVAKTNPVAPVVTDLAAFHTSIAVGAVVPKAVLWQLSSKDAEPDIWLSEVLRELQNWLAEEACAESRLIMLTTGAVNTRPDEDVDPSLAAVWGLVRSAQTENPGRFTLIDWDGQESPSLMAAAGLTDEPQLAVRGGTVSAPRLVPTPPAAEPGRLHGTVLITGGTGMLGGKVARHLVAHHDVRHLVLTSRRGMRVPQAQPLVDDLTALGATVDVVSCDITRRESVAELLNGIGDLTAIVHAAGSLADRLIEDLTPSDVAQVMQAKACAARYLHELTEGLDAFIMFSSSAATFGNIGQGNYAAANAYLEGLAQHRRAHGLPGTALAWGLWAERGEMTAGVPDAESFARLTPGVTLAELTEDEGLTLLDEFWNAEEASTLLVRVENTTNDIPILRASTRHRTTTTEDTLPECLRQMNQQERRVALLDLITTNVAAVLGNHPAAALTDTGSFKDVGMESLESVELRNRLGAALGRRLSSTVIFDYPSPLQLVEYLSRLVAPDESPIVAPSRSSERQHLSEEQVDTMNIQGLIDYLRLGEP